MPLLDHFHPPLKGARHWESFHGSWAYEMMGTLNSGVLPNGTVDSAPPATLRYRSSVGPDAPRRKSYATHLPSADSADAPSVSMRAKSASVSVGRDRDDALVATLCGCCAASVAAPNKAPRAARVIEDM